MYYDCRCYNGNPTGSGIVEILFNIFELFYLKFMSIFNIFSDIF